MRRYLLPLSLLACVGIYKAQAETVPESIRHKTIKVYSFKDNYFSIGSGISLNNNMFVTASHVIKSSNTLIMLEDNGPSLYNTIILSSNTENDITILKSVGDLYIPHTSVETEYDIGDPVYIVGSCLGLSDLEVIKAKISAFTLISFTDNSNHQPVFLTTGDKDVCPGYSGGGVFNTKGQLIGITHGIIVTPKKSYSVIIHSQSVKNILENLK